MAPAQPRRGPVQARAKERLERVLAAAEQVFAEVGYEEATTNQIARRAETSIGSLYEFLDSKQAIAVALAERYVADFRRLYDDAPIDVSDGSKAVDQFVDLVGDFYRRHPGLGPLMASGQGSDDLRAARHQLCASMIEAVDELLSQCPCSPGPAHRRRVAEMCAGILWTVTAEVAVRPEEDRELLLGELKLLLGSYVTTTFDRL